MCCNLALNPMSRRLRSALILTTAWFAWHTLALVIAQSPSFLQIHLSPKQNGGIAGEAVTCTASVTNAGPRAQRNVAVKTPVPPATKFVDTRHKDPNWYGGNPLPDANVQLEAVTLRSPKAFGPGEVLVFVMKTARSAALSSGRIDYG
jgi:uncharacterized repeat protein (TIGR01451 family)